MCGTYFCGRKDYKMCSKECRSKSRRLAQLGKPLSEEHRKALRVPHPGAGIYKRTPEMRTGRVSPSLKVREHMSLMRKGKKFSLETKKRMSESGKKKIFTEKHRKKLGEASKLAWNNPNRKRMDKINDRLSHLLRTRLNHAIKGNYRNGSAIRDMGCRIEELKQYLQSKFKEGMTWENRGLWGWHIDHIKPISSFNLSNREELLKAVHYTNLQPLWRQENLRKNKYYV